MGGMASAQTGRWVSELSSWGALGHFYPQKLESGRHIFSSASPQKCAEQQFCGFCVGFLLRGGSEGSSQ